MSDYHVMEIRDKGDSAHLAFHFDTPAGTNAAGVLYSDALVAWLSPTTDVPDLGQTEADAIAAGTVIEYAEMVEFDANATNQQKLNVIEARWTQLSSIIPGRIQENLRFWGFSGDVT